ncbi:hypothetical protein UFOVP48_24 [uncultured Caudovirales phage]|uniref:Uncharacterized protein n=1 Tax=uncultured Caudovirales phage TaxID=2100421 RepID=A0A6J5KQL0_9CAUD|nr:hypothetical protein UFOVP48_24 [uncultured Caudovirales phage]
MKTISRLKRWLYDEENVVSRNKLPTAFESDFIIRKAFVTTNGITLSIQMSGGHHCVVNESVELWHCPPSPLLMAYGDGQDPYPHVPLDVVAGYIDSLELLGDNHDYK